MWATFAHSPSWLAACRYGWWHAWPKWEAGSWPPWRLLNRPLQVTLSTLFLPVLSAWSMVRGHSVSPHITLMVGYLSAVRSGGELQPGHLEQLETAPVSGLVWTWEVGFNSLSGLLMYRCSASMEKYLKIRIHYRHLDAILSWYHSV